jgi:hypothetical protein
MEGKNIEMTLKEIICLADEGKMIDYQSKNISCWNDYIEQACLWYFEENNFLAYTGFTFYQRPDNTYEIVDGKERISFLLEFVKTVEECEMESLYDQKLVIDILFNGTEGELNYIYHRINLSYFLNEPKKRKVSLSKEKKKTIMYFLDNSKLKIPSIIDLPNIEKELVELWGFNPYKIMTQSAAIRRYDDRVSWRCLNCDNVFATTFEQLENWYKTEGWYCPKCHGNQKPVNHSK